MKKAWAWLKRWGVAILGTLVAVLTLGLIVQKKREKSRLGSVKDQLVVVEATAKMKELRARRQEVAAQSSEESKAILAIDVDLRANQRRIIEAHEGGEDLTDEEMLAEFAALGI